MCVVGIIERRGSVTRPLRSMRSFGSGSRTRRTVGSPHRFLSDLPFTKISYMNVL